MAGENFGLNMDNLLGTPGQEIMVDDDGQITATENTPNPKQKGSEEPEFKDGDLVTDDNGKVIVYNAKKIAKAKAKAEEEKENNKETVIDKGKEKEIKDAQKEEKKPTSKKDDISPYSPYAVALKDVGILPDLDIDEFNKVPKEEQVQKLVDEYKNGMQKGIQDYIDSQPQVVHDILNGLKEAGEYVPLNQLIQTQSELTELENVSEDDLKDNEELQEELISINLSETTKFSPEKIKKEIIRLKTSGELADEAIEAHQGLIKIRAEQKKHITEKAKQDKIVADKQRKEYFDKVNKVIDDTKELFPGTKLSETQKKELKDFLSKPIGYTKEGTPVSKAMEVRSKNPMMFDMRLNHYIQLGFFNDQIDTKNIERNAVSGSVKKLADIISKTNTFKPQAVDFDNEDDTTKKKPTAKEGIENFNFGNKTS
jgi:hypothetical protein